MSGQVPGFNSNMNVDLARLTTLPDLAGTDLSEFLGTGCSTGGRLRSMSDIANLAIRRYRERLE